MIGTSAGRVTAAEVVGTSGTLMVFDGPKKTGPTQKVSGPLTKTAAVTDDAVGEATPVRCIDSKVQVAAGTVNVWLAVLVNEVPPDPNAFSWKLAPAAL